jgi:hypothetical protein
MSNDITKKGQLLATTSSFEGWTDDVVTKAGDDERPASAGLIKGTLLKFTTISIGFRATAPTTTARSWSPSR